MTALQHALVCPYGRVVEEWEGKYILKLLPKRGTGGFCSVTVKEIKFKVPLPDKHETD